MIVNRYLYITDKGGARMTVGKNATERNEIRFLLTVNVPKSLFSKQDPVISIDLPDNIYEIGDNEIATITARAITEKLNVNVDDLTDHLLELMKLGIEERDRELYDTHAEQEAD